METTVVSRQAAKMTVSILEANQLTTYALQNRDVLSLAGRDHGTAYQNGRKYGQSEIRKNVG
jgi:hypothetical protein